MTESVLDASAVLAFLQEEPGQETVEALRALNLDVRRFDEPLALECAWLRQPTRDAGLSLGDRVCLALCKRLSCQVLTTDRSWNGLAVGVSAQLARP